MKEKEQIRQLSDRDTDRIIEIAWEDRTPFDAIEGQFGLAEAEVIVLMRRSLKMAFYLEYAVSLWKTYAQRSSGKTPP